MNLILAIPIQVRLVGLFLLGTCLGSLVNLAVYRLAWHPRRISPWSAPEPGAPPRFRTDRIPVVGWWGLRREEPLHGPGFWIRPMFVEILTGVALAWLYWWEIPRLGLLPDGVADVVSVEAMGMFHVQYACHVVLIVLMLIGSLIDIDEKIIPDGITVTGTLIGLALAAVYPWSLLPVVVAAPEGLFLDFLRLTSPNAWNAALGNIPPLILLVLGLVLWWSWCVALMPRTWYSRHGWPRALGLMWARMRREPASGRMVVLGALGSLGIVLIWRRAGDGWEGLLSALVGMAVSGGLVWIVRIIGTHVLRREAMGFGDVTLMAMIGTFLGWQPCLMVFFVAPFFALAVGLVILILHRESEIPYGPFLCMATVLVMVRWPAFWDWAGDIFALGWLVPLVMVVCMGLMAVLLACMQLVRGLFAHH